jgi:hypothetical protein
MQLRHIEAKLEEHRLYTFLGSVRTWFWSYSPLTCIVAQLKFRCTTDEIYPIPVANDLAKDDDWTGHGTQRKAVKGSTDWEHIVRETLPLVQQAGRTSTDKTSVTCAESEGMVNGCNRRGWVQTKLICRMLTQSVVVFGP